jgi:hypothetical protein
MVSVPSYYANVAGILGDGAEDLLTVVAKILLVGPEYFTVGAKISRWLVHAEFFHMVSVPRN